MPYKSKYERTAETYRSRYERRDPQKGSLEALRAEVEKKEAINQEYGADTPDQDKPGLVSRVVDILSRGAYASAGAFEEAVRPTGEGMASRAGRELLSGIGDIKGDKKFYGQVAEEIGIPEGPRLDYVLPFMYSPKTNPFLKGTTEQERERLPSPTLRDIGGLAADIGLDPLTYVTFGGATAGKVTLPSGVKYLNKTGLRKLAEFNRITKPAFDEALKIGDPILRTKRLNKLTRAADTAFEKKITPDMLDKGGVKVFGQSVIPGRAVRVLGEKTVNAMKAIPGGDAAIRSAVKARDSGAKAIASVFSPFGKLSGLSPALKSVAVKAHRDAMVTHDAIAAGLYSEWRPLKVELDAAFKRDPELGKKFYDIREGTGSHTLTREQQDLYDRVASFYDKTGESLVKVGVLDQEELLTGNRYFNHVWKNESKLPTVARQEGKAGRPSSTPKFSRVRDFKTVQEGIEKSRSLNRVDPTYPILEPDYNIANNMAVYIDQVASSVSKKQWADDVAARVGVDVSPFDITNHFDLGSPRVLADKERTMLDEFMRGSKGLRELEEAYEWGERTAKTAELVRAERELAKHLENAPLKYVEKDRLKNLDEVRYFRRRGWEIVEEGDDKFIAYRVRNVGTAEYVRWNAKLKRLRREVDASVKRAGRDVRLRNATGDPITGLQEIVERANRILPAMSQDGKREFFRELFSRVKSPSQFADIAFSFGKKWDDYFPIPIPTTPPEPGFVRVSGGVWGDRTLDLPSHIVDDVENFRSTLFRTQDLPALLRRAFQGYDWLNKWFKIGVYPFFPSSMTRDLYNNMMNSFLEIGTGAFRSPVEAATILKGKGRVIINGTEYDAALLKRWFADSGIIDPGGRTFVQIDDAERIYKLPTKVEKAIAARANIDNFSRAQLAVNHMRRGMDVRSAADRVRETLFAYNELSPTERSLFRRAIPFYTFPRKAIEFNAKMLKEKPGRVGALVKPFAGRHDEDKMMTSWESDAFKLRLDRDGKTITVITGVDIPIRTLDMLWAGSLRRTQRRLLGTVSPILKGAFESAANKSFFTDRDLDRQSAYLLGVFFDKANIHPKVKDWFGYRKDHDAAGRPKYTFDGKVIYLIQSWALSRVLSTSDRQFREYLSDGNYAAAILDLLTGLRFKDLNLEDQEKAKLDERLRQLNDAAVKRGIDYRFTRTAPRKTGELR